MAKQRGRKSKAELAVCNVTPLKKQDRQRPPDDMPEEEVIFWAEVVNAMPDDWFGNETRGLLEQYCQHRVAAKRIRQLITQCLDEDFFVVEQYNDLLKMQERESRAMSSLATKLRFTKQATRSPDARQPGGSPNKKPWES